MKQKCFKRIFGIVLDEIEHLRKQTRGRVSGHPERSSGKSRSDFGHKNESKTVNNWNGKTLTFNYDKDYKLYLRV